jgi:hypothetical protein
LALNPEIAVVQECCKKSANVIGSHGFSGPWFGTPDGMDVPAQPRSRERGFRFSWNGEDYTEHLAPAAVSAATVTSTTAVSSAGMSSAGMSAVRVSATVRTAATVLRESARLPTAAAAETTSARPARFASTESSFAAGVSPVACVGSVPFSAPVNGCSAIAAGEAVRRPRIPVTCG